MSELHVPWLEMAVLIPLAGAAWVRQVRDRERALRHSWVFFTLTAALGLGAWIDFATLTTPAAHDRWDLTERWLGIDLMVIDELNAPLIPMTGLVFLATALTTTRTKINRFSVSRILIAEALALAIFTCHEPWGVIILAGLTLLIPVADFRERGRSPQVFLAHLGLSWLLLVAGWCWLSTVGTTEPAPFGAVLLLTVAVLIRSGVAPLHCWLTDLFEHTSFGTALLFVAPMTGAYITVRLVLPVAPDWALRTIALWSLSTAVYAAGMALVQREARRFYSYLFLSHSSLVLVGVETATPVALAGALAVWLSVGLSLSGFGLTLRALEARTGRLSLISFHGLAERAPELATFFLLTGLASVGFPGTIGFVATELLIDGVVEVYPFVAGFIVFALTLQGIAVLQAYYRLFTGIRPLSNVLLSCRLWERLAVFALTLLILGGGLIPQPGIRSRYQAARDLIESRQPGAGPASLPSHVARHNSLP